MSMSKRAAERMGVCQFEVRVRRHKAGKGKERRQWQMGGLRRGCMECWFG